MEWYFDDLLQRANMVREWRKHVREVVRAVSKILPDAKVYVFGSVVRGEAVGGSDVDILIVSKQAPASNVERSALKLKIEEAAGFPFHHPFEIHLVDEEEAKWYFSRVKELTPATAGS
ncbi:MAG: nucleotidyltransferase domain-containing protein [Candidatus Caldarchaeum sp.]|nr:nucleotidyltransferase domain-containing protein [Candidatus Caldarchaeum sp.]MCS7138394.1 nucleotidyltransferase domain-containing protein [Candidatus Caldarchaeum sp.]MDW7977389.1 nucleotidyltransferase domain-containing protein [Candidatus Caldarchaeum sp.]MDW8359023.1 nucleotidyltransferase domain-containing protein [Candidatus Caldarchaeum sp.]